jgi:hypothetical protein
MPTGSGASTGNRWSKSWPVDSWPDWLTVTVECVDCGRWAKLPDPDMKVYITIGKAGIWKAFGKCAHHG